MPSNRRHVARLPKSGLAVPPVNATSLPLSLAPRGLSRVQAAEYIGVGVTKFDEMVADGRMPKAKRIDGRTVWDRMQLDAAFSAIDGDDEPNEWDKRREGR